MDLNLVKLEYLENNVTLSKSSISFSFKSESNLLSLKLYFILASVAKFQVNRDI